MSGRWTANAAPQRCANVSCCFVTFGRTLFGQIFAVCRERADVEMTTTMAWTRPHCFASRQQYRSNATDTSRKKTQFPLGVHHAYRAYWLRLCYIRRVRNCLFPRICTNQNAYVRHLVPRHISALDINHQSFEERCASAKATRHPICPGSGHRHPTEHCLDNHRHIDGVLHARWFRLLRSRYVQNEEHGRNKVRQRGIQPLLAPYGRTKREHGSGLGKTRYVVERTLSWFFQNCFDR